jgi:hypothetical protein
MWDWAIWGALIAGGLAGTGAIWLLVRRSLDAWRTLKDTRRNAAQSLGDLAAKAETTAQKVEASGDTVELQESVARLRHSLRQLTILRAALDDAQAVIPRL